MPTRSRSAKASPSGDDCFAMDDRVDRGEPARVRYFSHPHAISRHSALPSARVRRTHSSQELESLRHGARGVQAEADDRGAARPRLRALLLTIVLTQVHLASTADRWTRRAGLPRDVLPLQAIESILALDHQEPYDGASLEAARRVDPEATLVVSKKARKADIAQVAPSGDRRFGGSLVAIHVYERRSKLMEGEAPSRGFCRFLGS